MLSWWNWQTRHIQDVYFAGSSPAKSTSVRQYDNLPSYASVAESADAPDLKSGVRDGVRVQFPSEAPCRGVAQLVEQRSPKPCCVCVQIASPLPYANGPGRLGCGLQIRQKLVRLQSFAPTVFFALCIGIGRCQLRCHIS